MCELCEKSNEILNNENFPYIELDVEFDEKDGHAATAMANAIATFVPDDEGMNAVEKSSRILLATTHSLLTALVGGNYSKYDYLLMASTIRGLFLAGHYLARQEYDLPIGPRSDQAKVVDMTPEEMAASMMDFGDNDEDPVNSLMKLLARAMRRGELDIIDTLDIKNESKLFGKGRDKIEG